MFYKQFWNNIEVNDAYFNLVWEWANDITALFMLLSPTKYFEKPKPCYPYHIDDHVDGAY